jgi:hypothetical protein
MTLRTALALLSLSLAACGGGTTMEAHMTQLDGLISTSKSDMDSHKTAVAAAATLADITTLEGTHATKMTADVDSLTTSVKDMANCKKAGTAPDTKMMADACAAMKAEDDKHHTNMAAAADVTAARAEEDRHQKAMATQVDTMMSEQTSMMGMAKDYTCVMSM